MTLNRGRTALYRLYGESGDLLYVGISGNPEARFAQHRADKAWWPDVAVKAVEWYGSRVAAESAEEAAIKARIPRHNRAHSPEPPARVTVELSAAQVRGLDLLGRALSKAAAAPEAVPREDVLWGLVNRELASRGLLGESPCYESFLGWPEGVALPPCPVRAVNPCRHPDCSAHA